MYALRLTRIVAIDRILRYLKDISGRGIRMKKHNSNIFCGYIDADWAESFDQKSTTDYCTFIYENIVTSKSKKQNIIVRSSVEAEYRAMTSATSELIWIKQLLCDLNIIIQYLMKLFCDNQAVCNIISNPVFHERTKHNKVDVISFERRYKQRKKKHRLLEAKINCQYILKGSRAKVHLKKIQAS
jgi:hypothetical protein